MPATDLLSHAEVYSDGAVFYIGGSHEHPDHLVIHEAHNLALKLPLKRAEGRAAVMRVVDATFVGNTLNGAPMWRLVDLDAWGEENICAHYVDGGEIVRIYEYVPNAGTRDTRERCAACGAIRSNAATCGGCAFSWEEIAAAEKCVDAVATALDVDADPGYVGEARRRAAVTAALGARK